MSRRNRKVNMCREISSSVEFDRYSGVMTIETAPGPMSRRGGRPSKGDQREEAILDAAERLVMAGGYASASVADLAEAAGISRAAFYFYFASKEALLASVVDRAVQGFNDRIAAVMDVPDGADPAAALRASVEAAGELWWEHSAVLCTSVELGARMPEVYQRTQENLAIVNRPTVAMLRRYGRVPEAEDPEEADALVVDLTLLSERVFFHVMREGPARDELDRAVGRIARIWLRAFGLDVAGRAR
jgi:TetR/AcrR family transcriptional regulator, ethionamide resistance regulator